MESEFGAIGINNMSDRTEALQSSLDKHLLERERIENKILNPAVPQGKREKLKYRLGVLNRRVIPNKTEELRRACPLF